MLLRTLSITGLYGIVMVAGSTVCIQISVILAQELMAAFDCDAGGNVQAPVVVGVTHMSVIVVNWRELLKVPDASFEIPYEHTARSTKLG